jgi:hypothetical protein
MLGNSLDGESESVIALLEQRSHLGSRLAYLDLAPTDLEEAAARLAVETNRPRLDQYRATSIAGNAVWGSVFYS